MRVLPSGTIIYPNRGNPPKVPDGYIADPGNPFQFKPILQDCTSREFKEPSKRCCNQARYMYCQRLERRVVQRTCMDCDEATS